MVAKQMGLENVPQFLKIKILIASSAPPIFGYGFTLEKGETWTMTAATWGRRGSMVPGAEAKTMHPLQALHRPSPWEP